MKKLRIPSHPSPKMRTEIYFITFTVCAVAFELTRSPLFTFGMSVILFVMLTLFFTLFSSVYLAEKNLLSRITSASTVFLLCFIASRLSFFPALMLLIALGTSYLGSRPSLHIPHTRKFAISYGTIIAITALLLTAALVFATTVAYRIIYHY